MLHNLAIPCLLLAIWMATTVALANPAALEVPQATPEIQAYSTIRYVIYFVATAYSAIIYWGILQFSVAAKIRDAVARRMSKRFLQVMCFYAIMVVCATVLMFPLSVYGSFLLDHQFAVSNQTFGHWLTELGKRKLVSIAIGAPICALIFFVVNQFKSWGLVLWAVLVPIIAFMIFVYPVSIDPLFNKFSELKPSVILDEIRLLERRAGIQDAPVFIVDKSRQTKKVNAYVTGLAGTTRIVLWDTTLNKLSDEQVLSIVAHEIGHYVLGHVIQGFAMIACGLAVVLLLLQRFEQRLLALIPKRWGVEGKSDPAIIPLVLLASVIGNFVIDPVYNGISRHVEHEADVYALQLTGNGPAMASTFATLSKMNLSDPNPPPFVEFWLCDHPTLKKRFEFSLGKQPK